MSIVTCVTSDVSSGSSSTSRTTRLPTNIWLEVLSSATRFRRRLLGSCSVASYATDRWTRMRYSGGHAGRVESSCRRLLQLSTVCDTSVNLEILRCGVSESAVRWGGVGGVCGPMGERTYLSSDYCCLLLSSRSSAFFRHSPPL